MKMDLNTNFIEDDNEGFHGFNAPTTDQVIAETV
jgi:hypothetical protein